MIVSWPPSSRSAWCSPARSPRRSATPSASARPRCTVWNIAKWPVLLVVVILIVALLYYATPNVKQPKFRWISVGAVLAIVVWIVAVGRLRLLRRQLLQLRQDLRRPSPASSSSCCGCGSPTWPCSSAPSSTPSSSAAASCRPGSPAEEEIQLPPRDTRKIEKAEKKEPEDVRRGRRLRETAGDETDPGSDHDSAPQDSRSGR